MVWSRFSAWSNTMLAGDSKTSPVTSRPSRSRRARLFSVRRSYSGRGTPGGSA